MRPLLPVSKARYTHAATARTTQTLAPYRLHARPPRLLLAERDDMHLLIPRDLTQVTEHPRLCQACFAPEGSRVR